MRNLDLGGYALRSCAAMALLAGCGGSGTLWNPAIVGLKAERSHAGVTYDELYSFRTVRGKHPGAGLILVDGKLYGTTHDGGAYFKGAVFATTTSGRQTVVHSFTDSTQDGANPSASLLDVNGTLYGTTSRGGTDDEGTVFSVTPSGAENVLHSFTGGSDGLSPTAGLISVNGMLYGTTVAGGMNKDGTVFSITPSGTETALHSFGGSPTDGDAPRAALLNVEGTLYGTTSDGGKYGLGTVFSITPSGTETVLYSFKGNRSGAYPFTPLISVKGTLYGTTFEEGPSGYGTVFAITPSGRETVLHSFAVPGRGEDPTSGLINVKGVLYGTTGNGGSISCDGGNGCGTVYSVTTSGKMTVLHRFKGSPGDGRYPDASLVGVNGTLYGTTAYGGTRDSGTVFALTP